MIIVKLMGGLGNQLFQYAAGRSLAHAKQTDFFIDPTFYDNQSGNIEKRNFALEAFNIKPAFATKTHLNRFDNPTLFLKATDKLRPYYRKRYYSEQHFHFDTNFFQASSSVVLVGFWQSEKYFQPISDVIRKEFTITGDLSDKTKDVKQAIVHSNSVSIHIRRGDYVKNPETLRNHGVCEVEYYERAMKLISDSVSNPSYFVFSDDITWVKENLNVNGSVTFINHNDGAHAYEDMYLMSQCKHNIIANSTFSWWAAWLNNNENKKVIAPKKWFNEFKGDTKDLFPAGWMVI
jgi:hypothetical protein